MRLARPKRGEKKKNALQPSPCLVFFSRSPLYAFFSSSSSDNDRTNATSLRHGVKLPCVSTSSRVDSASSLRISPSCSTRDSDDRTTIAIAVVVLAISLSLSPSSSSNCIDDQSERKRRRRKKRLLIPHYCTTTIVLYCSPRLAVFSPSRVNVPQTRGYVVVRGIDLIFLFLHRLHSAIYSNSIMSNIVPGTNGHDSLPLPYARLESPHFGVYEIWQEKTVVGRKNNRREVDVDMGTISPWFEPITHSSLLFSSR